MRGNSGIKNEKPFLLLYVANRLFSPMQHIDVADSIAFSWIYDEMIC